jgi:hypothetical protein
MTSIVHLEAALETLLPTDRLVGPAPQALIDAAHAWSNAVWAEAAHQGAAALTPELIARGLDLAERPVFICGAHRSGTTLVRDLLDGHPSLSVLPAEGTFYTNLATHLAKRTADERLPWLAGEWLRRLANPINRPPYWLLGRTDDAASPYVTFARTLAAWWTVAERQLAGSHPSWPLVAVSLAYATATDRLVEGGAKRWVEKTPANEPFIDRLVAEFPGATIVQVIRHPFAVLASRKQLEVAVAHRFRQFHRALDDLARSFRVAVERSSRADGYCLVRYEDLVADTSGATHALADALGIAWSPSLLQPTVCGLPASTNSAAFARRERGVIIPSPDRTGELTTSERAAIAVALGDDAAALGYELPAVGAVRGRLLSLTRAIRRSP